MSVAYKMGTVMGRSATHNFLIRLLVVGAGLFPMLSFGLGLGDLQLDRLNRRVTHAGEAVDLTLSEFSMLEMLLLNRGSAVTKSMILEQVFDLESDAPGTIVEPHISRLRAKLTRAGAADFIRTLRGVGYTVAQD